VFARLESGPGAIAARVLRRRTAISFAVSCLNSFAAFSIASRSSRYNGSYPFGFG
jgi:hypothetical protein